MRTGGANAISCVTTIIVMPSLESRRMVSMHLANQLRASVEVTSSISF